MVQTLPNFFFNNSLESTYKVYLLIKFEENLRWWLDWLRQL